LGLRQEASPVEGDALSKALLEAFRAMLGAPVPGEAMVLHLEQVTNPLVI